jgi:hypothetical protein
VCWMEGPEITVVQVSISVAELSVIAK